MSSSIRKSKRIQMANSAKEALQSVIPPPPPSLPQPSKKPTKRKRTAAAGGSSSKGRKVVPSELHIRSNKQDTVLASPKPDSTTITHGKGRDKKIETKLEATTLRKITLKIPAHTGPKKGVVKRIEAVLEVETMTAPMNSRKGKEGVLEPELTTVPPPAPAAAPKRSRKRVNRTKAGNAKGPVDEPVGQEENYGTESISTDIVNLHKPTHDPFGASIPGPSAPTQSKRAGRVVNIPDYATSTRRASELSRQWAEPLPPLRRARFSPEEILRAHGPGPLMPA